MPHCLYPGCSNNSQYANRSHMQGVFFIPFPKPKKEPLRSQRWLFSCGRGKARIRDITRNWYVCSLHFKGGAGPSNKYPDPVPCSMTTPKIKQAVEIPSKSHGTSLLNDEILIGVEKSIIHHDLSLGSLHPHISHPFGHHCDQLQDTLEPLGQTMHPLGQHFDLLGEALDPPGQLMHPLGQHFDLLGEALDKPGQTMHPLGQHFDPLGETLDPRSQTSHPLGRFLNLLDETDTMDNGENHYTRSSGIPQKNDDRNVGHECSLSVEVKTLSTKLKRKLTESLTVLDHSEIKIPRLTGARYCGINKHKVFYKKHQDVCKARVISYQQRNKTRKNRTNKKYSLGNLEKIRNKVKCALRNTRKNEKRVNQSLNNGKNGKVANLRTPSVCIKQRTCTGTGNKNLKKSKQIKNKKMVTKSKKLTSRQLDLMKKLLRNKLGTDTYDDNVCPDLTKVQFFEIQTKAQLLANRALNFQRVLCAKSTKATKQLSEKCLKMVEKCPTIIDADNVIQFIGGKKYHNSNSESFFWEVSYFPLFDAARKENNDIEQVDCQSRIPILVVNPNGQVINNIAVHENLIVSNDIQTEMDDDQKEGLYWNCGPLCNIRQDSINRLVSILRIIASCQESTNDAKELYSNFDSCKYKPVFIQDGIDKVLKMGHDAVCLENKECESLLRCVTELAPHYSALRTLLKEMYEVKKLFNSYELLEKSICKANYDELEETVLSLEDFIRKKKKVNNNLITLSGDVTTAVRPILKEAELVKEFAKPLANCVRDMNEFHGTPCDCCERQYQMRKLTSVSKFVAKNGFENTTNEAFNILRTAWLLQKPDASDHELFEHLHLCDYCSKKIVSDHVPERCFLNGLEVLPVPDEITKLNMFEKMLIQKCKAFQVVVRLAPKMETRVMNHSGLTKAIKGKIIYLPLPLQDNIEMIPKNLPENHQLHILVNGQPTKKSPFGKKLYV